MIGRESPRFSSALYSSVGDAVLFATNPAGTFSLSPHRLLNLHFIMTPIPDTVGGAAIISLVDFILSFAIISGIGVILAALPIVNRFWNINDAKLRNGH